MIRNYSRNGVRLLYHLCVHDLHMMLAYTAMMKSINSEGEKHREYKSVISLISNLA